MADYKIELGVQLKVDDIASQINEAESKVDPITIKVDAETKELTKSIQGALKSLSSGTKNALTLDTSKVEASLNDVNSTIKEIKVAIGSLDSGSGMKSLVGSINSIGTALDKASNKFDELVGDLKSLSGKDFSLNFGINMGGSNPIARQSAYGNKARNETLPQLKQQINSLVKYYNDIYKESADEFTALQKLVSGTKLNNGDFFQNFLFGKDSVATRMSGGSLSSQMQAYKQYIDMFKQAASLKGLDLNGVTSSFSKTADDLIKDAQDIQTGAKEMDESFDKLKQIFSGGSNLNIQELSVQLDPIIKDLNEIREAVVGLSKGVSLDGLTASFDRLSSAIENLLTNAEKVKGVLNSGFDTYNIGGNSVANTPSIKSAQQTGQKIGESITKSAQQSINLDDVIDKQVLDLMNKFSITGDKGSDAFNEIKQAVIECRRELGILKNSNLEDFGDNKDLLMAHGNSDAIDKVTKAIANQMQVVKETTKEYGKLSDYITEYHNKGYKVHVPDSVRQEYGDDYNRMAKELSSRVFTSGKGEDFESFISQLNGQLGETISLTNGAENAFKQLYDEVIYDRKQRDAAAKSAKSLTSTASTEEILGQNGINRNEIYDDVMSIVGAVDTAEQKIAQSSAEMASEAAQSGEKIGQTYRETSGIIENLKTTLETMRVDRSSIDTIVKDVEELGFAAKNTSVEMKNGKFDITVNGIDDIGRAITEIRRFDSATDEISLVGRKISQPLVESDKFIKQQKKSVADLTNQVSQLNRSAIDQNASRPIKNSAHLDVLEGKYNEITSAIQRMGNASSNTFDEEANNVRALISEYKTLTKEFRNAENVSTKMKGTDFGSGLDIAKNDLEKFKAEARDFPQITATVKELDRAIEGVGDAASLNKFNDQLRVARSELARVKSETTALNRSEKVGINVSGLESKIADIQRISPEIDRFETEIDGAKVSVQSLLNDLKQVKTQSDFSTVNARFRAFKEAASAAGIAVTEVATKVKSINDIKIKISDTGFNGFEQEVLRARNAAEELENVYPNLEAALNRLDIAMAEVYSADQSGDVKRLVAANEEYEASLKQVYSQLKLNQQAEQKAYKDELLTQKKSALSSEMEAWLKENTRAARDFGEEIRRLQASLNGLDDKGVKLVGQQFKSIAKQAQAMGKTGLTAFDKLKSKAKEYMTYLSAAEMFMYAEQAFRSMFEQVKLIDSAMTELKKVTDETDASYNKFLSNAASRSKELGTTIDGLVSSTADFARLGYGFEDSQGLAEVANIYAVVGDEIEGVEGATESLVSTLAAFKDELSGVGDTDFAMDIIDKFNEVSNNFAISSGGIGEAMQRSASSLRAANNTIDESIALITAANTVVQDPTQVGTAFKTISMRIRGAKTELEEAGLETDGMVESTAKLRQEVLALTGVDIMDGTDKFKSTYAIMDELAAKWKDLSDIQQATVTELIAGKRQGNIVSSLMQNFNTAREALDTSLNSSGSAMREHAKWSESLEARLNKLKSTWQSLSQSFMSSNFLKGALDGVIALVNGLDKLIDTFGTLPTLAGVFAGGLSAFKNKGLFAFDKDAQSIELLGNNLKDLDGNFKKISTGINTYNSLLTKSKGLQDAYVGSINRHNGSFGKYLSSLNGAKASMGGYITSLVGAKVASFALQAATVAMNAALTMGISFLISAGISAIQKWINAKKELAEKVDEVTSKFQEQHTELVKNKSSFESQAARYGQLAKGVNDLGENVSLTADEYAEYQDIVNSIADQVPSLIQGYDAQGNAILNYKGNVKELTDAYEELIKKQNESVLRGDAYKDIEKDFKNAMEGAKSGDGGFMKTKASLNEINALEALLRSNNVDELIPKINEKYGANFNYLINELENAGVEKMKVGESAYDFVERAVTQNKDIVQRVVNDFNANLDAEAEGMRAAAQAALSKAFDFSDSAYKNINEKTQSLIRQVVGNFDAEQFDKIVDSGKTVEEYINDMLDSFKNMSGGEATQLEAAFDLQTKFNGGDISYGEYVNGIREAEDLINDLALDDEVKNQIKLTLDTEQIKTEYDALKTRLTSEEYNIQMKDDKAEEFLNKLSASEYQVAIDLMDDEDVDFNDFNSIKELKKYIEEQASINEAMAFTTDIKVDTTALELLNTALTESASAMGLTEESIDSLKAKYSKLESFDTATLFEVTANGIKVNREELAKLEKEYNDLTKSEVKEHIDSLAEAYNDVTAEIDKCKNAGERAQLLSKREGYKTQIEELAEYQAQLEGVTGAYQRWIDAQNTPEDYEGYQAIATSREDIGDEIDRGFISNATKEYIDLLSGEDLVGGTIDDYAEAWERLDKKVGSTSYSIHDFFTVNDDGDITATGIDRFFDGLQQDFKGSVYKLNEESGKWEYDFSQENLQKIQDEWGIGIEAIELLLEAAASAGYDIDWGGILDGIDLDTSNFETLVSYAEKAQKAFNELEGVEDVDFNFTATGVEEATSELEKARSTYIDLITNDDSINLKAEGADQMRVILSTLLVQKQQLEDSNIAINIDTSGLDESQQDISNAIEAVKTFREKYKNLEIAVTTGQGIDTAKSELSKAMGELQTLGGEGVDIAAQLILGEGTDGEALKTKVDAAITAVGDKNIKVGCKLDETAIGTLNSQLLTNFNPEATVKITGVDDALVDQYTSTEKTAEGTVKWKNDESLVVEYQEKTKKATGIVDWANNTENVKKSFSANGTVKWTSGNKVKVDVISEANGTAHSNGTANSGRAFARGNWGIKGNGTALGGELGRELVVRDGKFFTIGDDGAEFFKYKQNDIIFNAAQTESLFKYGGIKGAKPRGTMLATGSAFAEGGYPSSGRAFWHAEGTTANFANSRKNKPYTKTKTTTEDDSVTTTTTTSFSANVSESDYSNNRNTKPASAKSSSSSSSSSKEAKEEFEETFDLIEIAISRIEREIDNLDQKANRTYKSWSSRNKALISEIGKVGDEIDLQQKAYDRYIKEADKIGLSSSWAEKVRNGEIDIETIKDEDLAEKIKSYQDFYNKALDCKDAIENLKDTEAELYRQRFENIQSQYDGILQGYEHTETMLNEYISQAEAQGHIISKKYYQALINNEKQNIAQLKKEQSALIEARNEAEANGIDKNSQDWLDMCAEIDAVTQAIEEGTTSIIEYNNAIRDIEWEKFDLKLQGISDVNDEADFLIDLMSSKDLYDDKGKLTGQGAATLGLHGLKHNVNMYSADEYGKEIADIDRRTKLSENHKDYLDPNSKDVINRRRELVELQRQSILAAEDEKQSIKDLVEEGINLELDALQELIDKKNESLESEKELYEYQKKVQEQTENIANLRKTISSYENDDSEEAKAKIQELKISLQEAEMELEETEWDKYIQDTSVLLDNLYTEYETILNTRLDNIDFLLQQVIDGVNTAASLSTEQSASLLAALGEEGTLASALGVEGAIASAIVNAMGENGSIKNILNKEVTDVGTKLSTAMNSIWNVGEGNAKSVLTTYGEGFQNKQTTTNSTLSGIKISVDKMANASDKEAEKKTTANKTSTSAKKDPTKNTTTTKKPATTTDKSSGDGKAKIGDKVKFVSGKYYYDSYGTKPLGSKYQGKEVYITHINTKGSHPYHISTGKKLGSGDLGWLKLNQLSGYATGRHSLPNNEWAWTQEGRKQEYIIRPSDGAILTPVAKGDSVLNATASGNIWSMANNPAEFIRDNLKLDASNIPNGANVQSNLTQHFENINFNMPNIKNYSELLSELKDDPKFNKLILAMTLDQVAGKSKLAKGKSIR